MVETFQDGGQADLRRAPRRAEVARQTGMPLAPVMIYGDDVTHVLTEEGIAYLYKARSLEERQAMIGGWRDQSDRPAPRSARDPADAPRRADRAASRTPASAAPTLARAAGGEEHRRAGRVVR